MTKISTLVAAVALAMAVTPAISTASFAQPQARSTIVTTDHAMSSSKLIGMAIYNDQGKQIGRISDILVKGSASEPLAILTLGDNPNGGGMKMVGVPLSHVQLKSDQASMKASMAELAAMPAWHYDWLAGGGG